MRIRVIFALLFCCSISVPSIGQTTSGLPFLAQVVTKYPTAALPHSITLEGSATWVAGKLHEEGSGTLSASSDGTMSVALKLGSAAQTETRAGLAPARACTWTDAKAISHPLNLPDCMQPVPWFAPTIFLQPSASLLSKLQITDGASVNRAGSAYRLISFSSILDLLPEKMSSIAKGTTVSVLFDPTTLEPASIEYLMHSDKNLSASIRVRVVYGDYRLVEGLPVPFKIDRYVNDSLQLSFVVSNASVQ